MSKYSLLGSLALCLLSAAAYWQVSEHQQTAAESSSITETAADLSFTDKHVAGRASDATGGMPPSENTTSGHFMNSEEMSTQIEDALLQYEELSKYPPDSQPIMSEQHVHSFMNTSSPQASHPFPFDDLETPIQLSIELDQYNYFFGDAIQAQIKVGNVPDQAALSVRAVITDLAGEVLADVSNLDIRELSAKAVFDTGSYTSANWPLELNLGAHVDVNGYHMFISAPFRINIETAELDSIGYSEPVAENLVIPVNLNVSLPGYYFVAGILYSRTTDKPLIHLEAEGSLSEGISSLELKAHIQALKKSGDEGPYYLDKIRIERWSDDQLPRDVAGKVPPSDYSVQGYAFSDYLDKPYVDPLTEERKRLIQGLSSR